MNSNWNKMRDPISVSYGFYDALINVLLFPNSRDACYSELRFSNGSERRYTDITSMMYYRWHLSERQSPFNKIIHAASLF